MYIDYIANQCKVDECSSFMFPFIWSYFIAVLAMSDLLNFSAKEYGIESKWSIFLNFLMDIELLNLDNS